jgi:hypothetical protein
MYCAIMAFTVSRELSQERAQSRNPNSARILALEDRQRNWQIGAGAGVVLGGACMVLGEKKATE